MKTLPGRVTLCGIALLSSLAMSGSPAHAAPPGAPTTIIAEQSGTGAKVYFTPPASDGGSAITGYTVTSTPGGITGTGTASPVQLTGLTGCTSYTFTVKAQNASGNGAASVASNSVTAPGLPGAPTNLVADKDGVWLTSPNVKTYRISYSPPASDGCSPILEYRMTTASVPNMGYGPSQMPGPIYINPNDLPLGSHTFKVKARNVVGWGPESAASNALTRAIVPFAPTSVSATAGIGRAHLHITPAADGGSPITGFLVTSNPGNITATVGTAQIVEITGLAPGTTYTFTAKAINAEGTGNASPSSNSITTPKAPNPPTAVTAQAGNGQVTISFQPPTSDGGSPITSYSVAAVTASGPKITPRAPATSSPIVLRNLTNGTTYTFSVRAFNAVGGSAPSTTVSVTPKGDSPPPSRTDAPAPKKR